MIIQARTVAMEAALGNFLNCYLKETGEGEWSPSTKESSYPFNLRIDLPLMQSSVHIHVQYKSPTGRHRFLYPVMLRVGEGLSRQADYLTIITLMVNELAGEANLGLTDELIYRVIQSCHNTQLYIDSRLTEASKMYQGAVDFIAAEQSLLFGHQSHPTPKSRQGFADWKQSEYSPETGGRFQLHYFKAHRSLVKQQSTLGVSATDLMALEIGYSTDEDTCILPVHPHQAEWLLGQVHVKRWIEEGRLTDLGSLGAEWFPTSSVRTVYHPDYSYMLKFSLQVKITNSMRVNKLKELDAAIEADHLFSSIQAPLKERYPNFTVMRDPAYVTLGENGQESGFELIVRENLFQGEEAKDVMLIAGLVQDALPGYHSRLATTIQQIADQEGRSTAVVSLDWFRQYLDISLQPMMWLYLNFGIGLEAHLQNCLVRLKDGYPVHLYFRDNQGYYYCRSMQKILEEILPGIGEQSGNVYDDSLVDERFGYYLIVNHLFGLINGFGTEGLIDERLLLAELRSALQGLLPMNRTTSKLLHHLLQSDKIPCKANLLTRLSDLDELDLPLEQAVYVYIDNPLVQSLPNLQLIRKAKLVTRHWRRERVSLEGVQHDETSKRSTSG